MEIGAEISKKIRAAIKAKLVELGAYVDDELPDYIMVMVANKKTFSQMTDDLGLFLGSNTTKFTTWLCALLEKLQTITTNEGETAGAQPSAVAATVAVVTDDAEAAQVMKEESPPVDPEPPAAVPEVIAPDEDDMEPVIRLTPEFNDEFGEEVKPEIVVTPPSSPAKEANIIALRVRPEPKPLSPPSVRTVTIHASAVVPPSRVDDVEVQYKPQPIERRPVSRVSPKAVGSVSPNKVSPTTAVRKRRLPGSTIGAVLKHDIYDDDEYDPYNPFVGSVASVVKVTERRSSVPKTLQANKSLLFRAMNDAHHSIESARRTSGRGSVPPPMASSTPDSDVDTKRARLLYRSGGSRIARPRPRRSHDAYPSGERRFSPPMFSRSSRSDPHRQLHASAAPTSAPDQGFCEEGDNTEGDLFDSRTVQSDENVSLAGTTTRPRLNLTDLDVAGILLSRNPSTSSATSPLSPKFVVTLDGAGTQLLQTDVTMMEDSDEEMMSEGGDEEWDEEEEEEMGEGVAWGASNVVRVKPQRQSSDVTAVEDDEMEGGKKLRRNKRCNFWPKCKNGETCRYHHPTVPCRDFRKCSFGADKCFFVHPTCKFNASCTRSDCPYTHTTRRPQQPTVPIIVQPIRVPMYPPTFAPTPRFGAPPRFAAPPGGKKNPSGKKTCRFFPQCHNMDCPFEHPKMCRYGLGCHSKTTCTFSHPPLPSKDKLKWTSTAANGAE